MFKTAKIAEKTIYKEFRIHHDFDSHRSLRYINIIPIILYKYKPSKKVNVRVAVP